MYSYLFSLITAGLITAFAIPSIIRIAEIKHLFDVPDERKQHRRSVPTLGGMAIFAGLIFSVTFWTDQVQIVELQFIITSLLILFFIGIKDDLVNLRASKKLIGQVLAALIIVHMAHVKLTTFYGMFGIRDLPVWFSYIFSIFTCVVITNAFNLIDGIDGLAGSLGIIGAFTFGLWYHFLGMTQYTILCSALIGSLLAFLWFNKTPAKIFMGDTGSMLIGFVMALLSIKFIESVRVLPRDHAYKILSVPVFTCTILIIPLFDTLRVFIIRMSKGKSPFHPDRMHIHHILIDLGLTHLQATACLVMFNISMIVLIFLLQGVRGEYLLALILIIPTIITHILTKMRYKGIRKVIPWYVKFGIKLVRGLLPIKYTTLASLGFFRHGRMDTNNYALNVFNKHFPANLNVLKDPFVFLEIGPGDSLFSGIIASSKGAKKSYLIDNGNFISKDITVYLMLIEELYGRDYLKKLKIKNLEDIKRHFNIEYMTQGLDSLKSLPDNSVDISFSNACFEHVQGDQVSQYFKELKRVSRNNAFSSHCIDFKDHLSYSLNNLRFSKDFWESELVKKSGIYTNRLRFPDMITAIEQAGFNCQVTHVEKWEHLPTELSKLNKDFQTYKLEDLLIKEAWFRLT